MCLWQDRDRYVWAAEGGSLGWVEGAWLSGRNRYAIGVGGGGGLGDSRHPPPPPPPPHHNDLPTPLNWDCGTTCHTGRTKNTWLEAKPWPPMYLTLCIYFISCLNNLCSQNSWTCQQIFLAGRPAALQLAGRQHHM